MSPPYRWRYGGLLSGGARNRTAVQKSLSTDRITCVRHRDPCTPQWRRGFPLVVAGSHVCPDQGLCSGLVSTSGRPALRGSSLTLFTPSRALEARSPWTASRFLRPRRGLRCRSQLWCHRVFKSSRSLDLHAFCRPLPLSKPVHPHGETEKIAHRSSVVNVTPGRGTFSTTGKGSAPLRAPPCSCHGPGS